MPRENPYSSGGNPNHPGVTGGPYGKAWSAPNQDVMPSKIDPTGTGTFPPEAQGIVGRAQPAGLSAHKQYGLAAPGVVPGESPLAGPMVHPLPSEAEEGAIGKAPEPQTQESLLEAKEERVQAQLDQIREQRSAASQKDKPASSGYDPNAIVEEDDETEDSDETDSSR